MKSSSDVRPRGLALIFINYFLSIVFQSLQLILRNLNKLLRRIHTVKVIVYISAIYYNEVIIEIYVNCQYDVAIPFGTYV